MDFINRSYSFCFASSSFTGAPVFSLTIFVTIASKLLQISQYPKMIPPTVKTAVMKGHHLDGTLAVHPNQSNLALSVGGLPASDAAGCEVCWVGAATCEVGGPGAGA